MQKRPHLDTGTLIFMSLAAAVVSLWAVRTISERRRGVTTLSLGDLAHTDLSIGSITSVGRHAE